MVGSATQVTFDWYWKLICLCLLQFSSAQPHPKIISTPVNESDIQNFLNQQTDIITNLLENYDVRLIPTIDGHPLTITLEVVVSDILRLEDMEAEMQILIRQQWYDFRLKFNSTKKIKVRRDLLDKVWLPDIRLLNVINVKQFHMFGEINMNIYPNGTVYFSQRALVTVCCPMQLQNFPMDRQTCFLNFSSSFAYGEDLVRLKNGKVSVRDSHLPQYVFVKAIMQDTDETLEHISRVNVALVFQRRSGYYILQIYVPSTFLVVLSWLAFLMEPSNIADRLALEITMILSIVFLLGGINDSIPHVSYAKASDLFVIVSFGFVFLVLLETMLVYRITMMSPRKKKRTQLIGSNKHSTILLHKLENKSMLAHNGQESNADAESGSSENQNVAAEPRNESCNPAVVIDRVCLVAFPGLFIGFIFFYSFYYSMQDK